MLKKSKISYYDADERIAHVYQFFKKEMKYKFDTLERSLVRLVLGDYLNKPMSPDDAAEKLSTKDIKVYVDIKGYDLEDILAKAKAKAIAKTKLEKEIPLNNQADVCHAWFEVYEPNGSQSQEFYGKVTKAAYDHFKHIYLTGYVQLTNQGAYHLTIDPKVKDFSITKVKEELEFVLKYVKPLPAPTKKTDEYKEGEKHVHVSTPDCSERGVVSLIIHSELDKVSVDFACYHRSTIEFTGTLTEALEYVVKNRCIYNDDD